MRSLLTTGGWTVDQSSPDHGRPELVFDAAAPDIAGMLRALEQAGCLSVRNLFDPAGSARVRERAEFASRAWDFMVARGYTKGHEDFLAGPFPACHIPSDDIDTVQTTA